MKKISSTLISGLIILCLSAGIYAQSSEQELDQVELMKQFIGTWTVETGEDSTLIMETIPFGYGYEINYSWQAKGETYSTTIALFGFADRRQKVVQSVLWPSGWLSRDMGKFVSDKKMTWERFNFDQSHVITSFEVNFITPDKFKAVFKNRGMKETWDDAEVTEYTYTRVK